MIEKVKEALKRIFAKHRLVFWYDKDGSMQDIFNQLDIEAEKIVLDNNEFGVKYRILRQEPDEQFLIYSPKPKPENDMNFMLDLNLSNHIFDADQPSLILTKLGLDVSFKPIIEEHIAFFKSERRLEKLQSFEINTKDKLLNAITAVTLDTNNNTDDFVFAMLRDYANNSDEKLKQLKKYDLLAHFFNLLNEKFGFKGDNFKEFIIELIQTHFYFKTGAKKQISLNQESVLFVSKWMDSSRNKVVFEALSKEIANELDEQSEIENMDIKNLIEADTFEAIEKKILSSIRYEIIKEDANFDEIFDVIKKRKVLFWYERFKNIYSALFYTAKFFKFLRLENFSINSIEDGFGNYTKSWYKGDFYYRKFLFFYKIAEDGSFLKPIKESIENKYLYFQKTLNDEWQKEIDKIENYKINDYTDQKDFFKHFIEPNLDKRVFVVISDALRYEAGFELYDKLNKQNRYQVSIDNMYSSLPSYTQLGIASLLPHGDLSFGDKGIVYVDGENSSGAENRDKILKKYSLDSVYISADNFLSMRMDDGREFAKKYKLFYIYHNDIDAIGDNALSEESCAYAVEKAFNSLDKIIKKIFNLNGSFIVVTADHGFLYQEKKMSENELCFLEKFGDIKKSNRRFVIGKNLYEDKCVRKFYAKDLNINSDDEVLIARSISRIKTQGSGNRFVHGGCSLQEIAVPVIICKKIRKDDVRSVEVDVIKRFSKITSNNISISLIQRESIDDKIHPRELKAAFYSEDGVPLTDTKTVLFDKKENDKRGLEQKISFIFSQKAQDYQGKNVFLKMFEKIKGTNKEKLYKQESFELLISFVNDFDEF